MNIQNIIAAAQVKLNNTMAASKAEGDSLPLAMVKCEMVFYDMFPQFMGTCVFGWVRMDLERVWPNL